MERCSVPLVSRSRVMFQPEALAVVVELLHGVHVRAFMCDSFLGKGGGPELGLCGTMHRIGAFARLTPRIVREHLSLSVAVLCLVLGSGFRLAAGTAAGAGAHGSSSATACPAK